MKKLIEVLGLVLGITMGMYLIKYTYEKQVINEVVELTKKIIENTEARYIND